MNTAIIKVVGDRKEIQVGDYVLFARVGEDEPLIKDIDLGRMLGYANPIDIRQLIRRMMDTGKLLEDQVFVTATKTSPNGGRPGSTYWLTEAQGLKVCAKSETDVADSILNKMIEVFMLARRGLLQPVKPEIKKPELAMLQGMLDQLIQQDQRLAQVETQMAQIEEARREAEERLDQMELSPQMDLIPTVPVRKQIADMISAYGAARYATKEDYKAYRGKLYREFRRIYRFDVYRRHKNALDKTGKDLEYIEIIEKAGKVNDLFALASKMFGAKQVVKKHAA